MKLQISSLPTNIWNNEMAQRVNCPLLHLHTNNKVFLLPPWIILLCSILSLLPSPTLLWNDLCCYNYWVISTVITLNICSVTMLKAFGCALGRLFYVLNILCCRQTILPVSVYSLCIRHEVVSLWVGGRMFGWFASGAVWVRMIAAAGPVADLHQVS